MATLTWTPADGFTRKTQPVKPKPVEKPKPTVQPSKRKRPKPSALKRQRAYWLKQNQITAEGRFPLLPFASLCWLKQNQITARTIADDYLIKQAKTATPMMFVDYGIAHLCTVQSVWRYDLDLIIDGRKKRIHKLNLSLYYKAQDQEAVEKLLTFDSDSVRERPKKKLSERDVIDLSALERNATVTLTLRTGHRFTGVVRWVTAYDAGLTLSNGAKAHVFKHAISCCQPQR